MATVTYSWVYDVFGFVLNSDATGSQADVAITATADGGYLGAWSVGSADVVGDTSMPTARRAQNPTSTPRSAATSSMPAWRCWATATTW